MSNRIPQSNGHGVHLVGPSGPGLLAFFGCFGFLAWRVIEYRGLDKRRQEYWRKNQLIRERREEIDRLLAQAGTNKRW